MTYLHSSQKRECEQEKGKQGIREDAVASSGTT